MLTAPCLMATNSPVRLRPAPLDASQIKKGLPRLLERGDMEVEEIPNFLKILAKAPAAALVYMRVDGTLAAGQLTERLREQIALAVAEINGSNYCLQAHSVIGRNAGLSENEIQLARHAGATDPKTNQILHFTQAVVLQRGDVGDEDLRALRASGISDAEILEILANIALNIFTNYLNILSRTEVDFPVEVRSDREARVTTYPGYFSAAMNATKGCKEARGGETPPALAGEDACATSVKYPG